MSFIPKLLQGLGVTLVVGKIKHELDKLEGFVGFISRVALAALVFFFIWGVVFLVGYKFVPPENDQFRVFLFWIVTIVSLHSCNNVSRGHEIYHSCNSLQVRFRLFHNRLWSHRL